MPSREFCGTAPEVCFFVLWAISILISLNEVEFWCRIREHDEKSVTSWEYQAEKKHCRVRVAVASDILVSYGVR